MDDSILCVMCLFRYVAANFQVTWSVPHHPLHNTDVAEFYIFLLCVQLCCAL